MPVNPPQEYYVAEQKFQKARTLEEKIVCLEEMIRQMPRHHGSETALAQLKSRLSKLKKDAAAGKKKGSRKVGITKEGEAQVCLVGLTNTGKSLLLSKLTGAKPDIAEHPYTTTKPEVGMIDYYGVKIQLIEIPSTFQAEHMSTVRTADLVAVIANNDEERNELNKILDGNFIRSTRVYISPVREDVNFLKEKIWKSLCLMIVYTKTRKKLSPMALPIGATVKEFAQRIHKDFIKNFRFARLFRRVVDAKGVSEFRTMQVGLDYKLHDGDVVELHMK